MWKVGARIRNAVAWLFESIGVFFSSVCGWNKNRKEYDSLLCKISYQRCVFFDDIYSDRQMKHWIGCPDPKCVGPCQQIII